MGIGQKSVPCDEADQGEFLAVQEVLDNDLGTGGAEAMVDEDVFECALMAVSLVHGHGHALACRQTVGLDDNRGTVLVYVCPAPISRSLEGACIGRSGCCVGP